MKISVVLPSRGLIFAEVEDALSRELQGHEYKIFRSFTLPIPDCQNYLTDLALADNPDYVLYVEEDTVIPDGGVDDMIMAKADIACIDYAVHGYSCITKYKGENMWCGLGCTLVRRGVFDKLEKPYFKSDKLISLNDWPNITWINAGEQGYGGQDIYFGVKVREAGFKITQVSGECKHLKLVELGRAEINKGLHTIGIKDPITKHQTL